MKKLVLYLTILTLISCKKDDPPARTNQNASQLQADSITVKMEFSMPYSGVGYSSPGYGVLLTAHYPQWNFVHYFPCVDTLQYQRNVNYTLVSAITRCLRDDSLHIPSMFSAGYIPANFMDTLTNFDLYVNDTLYIHIPAQPAINQTPVAYYVGGGMRHYIQH